MQLLQNGGTIGSLGGTPNSSFDQVDVKALKEKIKELEVIQVVLRKDSLQKRLLFFSKHCEKNLSWKFRTFFFFFFFAPPGRKQQVGEPSSEFVWPKYRLGPKDDGYWGSKGQVQGELGWNKGKDWVGTQNHKQTKKLFWHKEWIFVLLFFFANLRCKEKWLFWKKENDLWPDGLADEILCSGYRMISALSANMMTQTSMVEDPSEKTKLFEDLKSIVDELNVTFLSQKVFLSVMRTIWVLFVSHWHRRLFSFRAQSMTTWKQFQKKMRWRFILFIMKLTSACDENVLSVLMRWMMILQTVEARQSENAQMSSPEKRAGERKAYLHNELMHLNDQLSKKEEFVKLLAKNEENFHKQRKGVMSYDIKLQLFLETTGIQTR